MQKSSLKNKSKRVQKKLFLGEFAVYGFEVTGKISQESEFDSFFDDFMIFIESKGLCFGGGYTKDFFDGFITHIERYGSASEEDRREVENWLSSNSNLTDIKVDGLVDSNYGI
jgi:uncharacterized protein YggL (DUF469 family)